MLLDQGGYLSVAERQLLGGSQLAVRGQSASGKRTYTGVKKPLKESQCSESNSGLCK